MAEVGARLDEQIKGLAAEHAELSAGGTMPRGRGRPCRTPSPSSARSGPLGVAARSWGSMWPERRSPSSNCGSRPRETSPRGTCCALGRQQNNVALGRLLCPKRG